MGFSHYWMLEEGTLQLILLFFGVLGDDSQGRKY